MAYKYDSNVFLSQIEVLLANSDYCRVMGCRMGGCYGEVVLGEMYGACVNGPDSEG